jgi:uncharacterized protein YuzE
MSQTASARYKKALGLDTLIDVLVDGELLGRIIWNAKFSLLPSSSHP